MVYRKIPQPFCHRNIKAKLERFIINELPKTFNDAVYPRIPFSIPSKPAKISVRGENNPSTQLYGLTFAVSDLFRDERVKLNFNKALVIRPHVERLIVEAMRNGDRHRPTMDLANYWLREKNLIHKLFKVFVPRYSTYASSFTAIHRLGHDYSRHLLSAEEIQNSRYFYHRAGEGIIEMRGNCLPPIVKPSVNKHSLLTNVLVGAAREASKADNKL